MFRLLDDANDDVRIDSQNGGSTATPVFDASGTVLLPNLAGEPHTMINLPPAVFTWLGGSGNWNDASDWSPNGVPGTSDDAVITAADSAVTMTANISIALLTLGGSSDRIYVGDNTFALDGSGSTISGSIAGNGGTLALTGGSQAIDSGARISISNWTLSGGDAANIAEDLTYAGALTAASGTSLTVESGDRLALNGDANIAGTIKGMGTLTLGGGTDSFDTGAVISVANLDVSNDANLTINENFSYGGALIESAGATLSFGANTMTLRGEGSVFAGTLSGSGSLLFSGGSQDFSAGATLDGAHWRISGLDSVGINENLSYAGALSDGAGTYLSVSSGDTLSLTGASKFTGFLYGGGTLALAGGTDSFYTDANIGTGYLAVSGGAVVSLYANVADSAITSEAAGATISIGYNDTLALSRSASFAGSIAGQGALVFTGGAQDFESGATLTIKSWAISANDAVNIDENISYGEDITTDKGTSLTIGSGDTLTFNGTYAQLSGAIGGSGTLALVDDGSMRLFSGATITVANWTIDSNSGVYVEENLTYAGQFTSNNLVEVDTGYTLSFTGQSTLSGYIATGVPGGGTVAVSDATASNLQIGDGVTLDDVASLHQTGTITIGDSYDEADIVAIASGASYFIDGDYSTNLNQGDSAAAIDNSGLLIKDAGTGESTIGVSIVDNGTVEAGSGTLDIGLAITGSGALQVDANATLEVDAGAAASLQATFNGAGATLALSSPSAFAATINGFAATDVIDLLKIQATSATLESGDELVIMNGSNTVATLQLAGDYTGYTFNVGSDGHSGTDITATPPAADNFYFGTDGQNFTSNGHAADIFVSNGSIADTFDFNGNFGTITVTGYQPGSDTLNFDHNDFANIAAVEAHATKDSHGDTVIALNATSSITLMGVTLSQFEAHASDWHFI